MSDLKVGDRVKVAAFEATVNHVYPSGKRFSVWADGTINATVTLIPRRYLELIPEPTKVGDKVTADNIDRLPPGTVIRTDLGTVAERQSGDGWLRTGTAISLSSAFIAAEWDATVIYLPDTAESSH
jgi:hypothetical protein